MLLCLDDADEDFVVALSSAVTIKGRGSGMIVLNASLTVQPRSSGSSCSVVMGDAVMENQMLVNIVYVPPHSLETSQAHDAENVGVDAGHDDGGRGYIDVLFWLSDVLLVVCLAAALASQCAAAWS